MDIEKFISNFKGGGSRANRFRVQLAGQETLQFLCKAASLPEATLGVAEANYMGRVVKIAGDKEFTDWNITVYNDTDFGIRNFFEQWQDRVLGFFSNMSTQNNPADYLRDCTVIQLGRDDVELARYRLKRIFPTSVGAITLDYSDNNTLETFDVTFAVNWFEHEGVTDFGGVIS